MIRLDGLYRYLNRPFQPPPKFFSDNQQYSKSTYLT